MSVMASGVQCVGRFLPCDNLTRAVTGIVSRAVPSRKRWSYFSRFGAQKSRRGKGEACFRGQLIEEVRWNEGIRRQGVALKIFLISCTYFTLHE